MSFPPLDPAVHVLAGTDVSGAWERFEVFEALHHDLTICNPMTSDELNDVVSALEPRSGEHVLDVACGSGEFLFRLAERVEVSGTGIDLSPWMISAAIARSQARRVLGDLRWVLGEARDYRLRATKAPDVIACIGAEWIWHDFGGTARALAERTSTGARVAIGAARLHLDADAAHVAASHGRVETLDEQRELLTTHGFSVRHRVDPSDAGWDAYIDRTASAATAWADMHPGPRAERYKIEQQEWQVARERDRKIIGWSVWIAERN